MKSIRPPHQFLHNYPKVDNDITTDLRMETSLAMLLAYTCPTIPIWEQL